MRPNVLLGLANKEVARMKEAGEFPIDPENPTPTPSPSPTPNQAPPAPAPVSEEDKKELETLNSLFEKHTGGKKFQEIQSVISRKSLDDEIAEAFGKPRAEVDTILKTPPAPLAPEFKTPLLKQHYEFVENGGTEEQWEANVALKKSLGTMSPEQLLKLGLLQENPGAEPADIETLYSSMYRIPKELDPAKFDEDEVAERLQEINAVKVRMKMQAEKIRAAEQAKTIEALKAPVSSARPIDPALIEAGNKLKKAVFDTFEATKGVEVEVVEGEKGKETRSKLTFDLKPEQRELAKQILNSPTGFFDAMCSKDGVLDHEKFVRAATLIAGGNEAIETMALDLLNAKMAEFVKELKNANFSATAGTPAGDLMQTAIQKATKQVFGGGKR